MLFIVNMKRQSKWAVTEEEMSGHHYPDFLSGWFGSFTFMKPNL